MSVLLLPCVLLSLTAVLQFCAQYKSAGAQVVTVLSYRSNYVPNAICMLKQSILFVPE